MFVFSFIKLHPSLIFLRSEYIQTFLLNLGKKSYLRIVIELQKAEA